MSDKTPENKGPQPSNPATPPPEEKRPPNGDPQKTAEPSATPAANVDVRSTGVVEEPVTDKIQSHLPPTTPPATPAATVSATDDTLPRKTGALEQKNTVQPVAPMIPQDLPDLENPYMLTGEVDRARLVAQTRLFRGYIERNAKQFVGEDIKSILDMGCGEGQLTLVFAKLYPQAKIIGIDKDEKAIDAAQRAAKGIANVEFRVGDILQGLPEGPFDLVYESLVLMHVPGTARIIKSVYDVLKPGGFLWTKDLHPNMETAIDHPAFARLSKWMGSAMDRIGAPWRIGGELSPILNNTGFKILKTEEEVYTLGTQSTEERITMAINLGALYNARKLMTRVLQVPEIEMENAYKELVAAMMAPNGPRGNFVYMNVVSQRPATAS